MGSRYHPSIYRVQPGELAAQRALTRRAIDSARELLQHEPPDCFLGRQHYGFVPLPEETAREVPP